MAMISAICMYDQNLLTKEDDDYAAYVAGNMTPFLASVR